MSRRSLGQGIACALAVAAIAVEWTLVRSEQVCAVLSDGTSVCNNPKGYAIYVTIAGAAALLIWIVTRAISPRATARAPRST
jgi:hypothetical protein